MQPFLMATGEGTVRGEQGPAPYPRRPCHEEKVQRSVIKAPPVAGGAYRLSVVEALDLVFGLAADIDAEAAVELNVLLRDNDGEVSVAALEGGEILFHHGGEGIGKAGDGQRQERRLQIREGDVVGGDVTANVVHRDQRYAQGIGSVKYFMGNVVEDFENYRKSRPRHNAKEILDDFNRFAADRKGLQKLFDKITRGKELTTLQSDAFNKAWERFSKKWKR